MSQLFGEGVDPVGELLTMYRTAFKVVGVIKAQVPFGVAYIPTNSYVALFPNQLVAQRVLSILSHGGSSGREVGQLEIDLTAVMSATD